MCNISTFFKQRENIFLQFRTFRHFTKRCRLNQYQDFKFFFPNNPETFIYLEVKIIQERILTWKLPQTISFFMSSCVGQILVAWLMHYQFRLMVSHVCMLWRMDAAASQPAIQSFIFDNFSGKRLIWANYHLLLLLQS